MILMRVEEVLDHVLCLQSLKVYYRVEFFCHCSFLSTLITLAK